MPKARTAKNCYYCEAEDRIKMTFMLCGLCHRHFCSAITALARKLYALAWAQPPPLYEWASEIHVFSQFW